jgi:excisionase family DNA binding protein
MTERLLTTVEAAAVLGLSRRTLEDWRLRGGSGLVYRKVGRLVRYHPADLDAFVAGAARINTAGAMPSDAGAGSALWSPSGHVQYRLNGQTS